MHKIVALLIVEFVVISGFGVTATIRNDSQDYLLSKTSSNGTEYWGLLIGVNEYYNYPEDSFIETKLIVERLYDTLLLSDHWQSDHIKVLTDKNTTRKNIIDAFHWLDEQEDEDDVCFIVYSGHGMINMEVFPPFDEDDRYDGYLTTYWTSEYISKGSLPRVLLGLYITTISDDKFNSLLSKLESKGVCVLISACQGGEFDDPPMKLAPIGSYPSNLFFKTARGSYDFCHDLIGSNRVILMPCQEDEGVDGSWFVDFVTQGFQGYADVNHDGFCTAEEAFNYSAPLTTRYSENYTYFTNYPSIFDDYPGELVISQSELPPSTPETFIGPTTGVKGTSYTFKTSAKEPEDELIRYYVEWGDGNQEYSDYCSSNELVSLSHSWNKEGVFNFYIYSEDNHGSRNIFPYKNVISITDENKVDQVQLNHSFYSYYPVTHNVQVAQSFKPQIDHITKIALPIYSRGNDLVFLHVKKNLFDEDSLAESCILIPPTNSHLVNGVYDWTVFDIPDINVNKNETYYIVCNTSFFWSGQQRNLLASNIENVYPDGSLFYSTDYGQHWAPVRNEDACFVTYGKV